MARLFLRIQVNKENADSVPMQIETDDSENNVSSLLSNRVSVPENDGVEGKSFGNRNNATGEQGWLDLADGYLGGKGSQLQSEQDKYQGFMFGVTNDKGEYELTLEISGGEIEKIVVIGDKTANQFPTKAYLDGSTTPIYSDDANWAIKFPSEALTHTIKFTNWNRADYNACFTTLKILATYLDLNRAYIEDLDTLTQSSSAPTTIQNGVLANSGSANLADIDGELRDYFEDGIIENSNVPVEVWLNGKKIRTHITTDSDYEENTQLLKLQMTNGLSNWDNITYSGRVMTSNVTLDVILREVLEKLYTKAEVTKSLSTNIVFGVDNKVGTVGQYLSTINIPYAYLKSDTYRNTINKICDVAQLQCYADSDGKPVFVSSRPIATQDEIDNAVRVKSYTNITNLQRSVILKNKYDGIDGEATKVEAETDVMAIVYSVSLETFTVDTSKTKEGGQTKIYYKREYNNVQSRFTTSYRATATFLENTYMQATVRVPKLQNGNLIDIQKVYDYLNDGVQFSVVSRRKYNKRMTINADIAGLPSLPITQSDDGLVTDNKFNVHPLGIYKEEETTQEIPIISQTDFSDIYSDWDNVTTKVELKDMQSATVTFDNNTNEYVVKYIVRIGSSGGNYRGFNLGWKTLAAPTSFTVVLNGEEYTTEPVKVSVSIYGDKLELVLNNTDISTDNIETAKTPATITANELLQTTAAVGSANLVDNMKSKMLSDYKNGALSGNIDLFPDEFVNKDDNVVVSYNAGELIEPNKVVYFDGDLKNDGSQRYWRVKGSHFKFDTEPTTSIELQEVVNVYRTPLYTIALSNELYAYDEDNNRVYSGDQVKCGTRLKFVFQGSSISYKFKGVWINDKFTTEGNVLDRIVYGVILDNSVIKAEYDLYEQKEFSYTSASNATEAIVMSFNSSNVPTKDVQFNFNNGQVEYDLAGLVTDELQEVHNANTDIMGQFAFCNTYMTQQNINDDGDEISSAYSKPMKITALMYSKTIIE